MHPAPTAPLTIAEKPELKETPRTTAPMVEKITIDKMSFTSENALFLFILTTFVYKI